MYDTHAVQYSYVYIKPAFVAYSINNNCRRVLYIHVPAVHAYAVRIFS